MVTNQSPFYAESGGQMGDYGLISNENMHALVTDTQKRAGDLFIHQCQITDGTLKVDDNIHMKIDVERRNKLRANHSATHLLHEALRQILGSHVMQKGSLVAEDKLRFDFSQPQAVSPAVLTEVELKVNRYIRQNREVVTRISSPEAAKQEGAMALFGEKYSENVRVVSMGYDEKKAGVYSYELCGGTHVRATGDIGCFKIISESSVSAGVRRIEAVTGEAAESYMNTFEATIRALSEQLKCTPQKIEERVNSLTQKIKQLEKEIKTAIVKGKNNGAENITKKALPGGGYLLAHVLEGATVPDLRSASDTLQKEIGSGVIVLMGTGDNKVSIVASVTQDSLDRYNAIEIVQKASEVVGGKGGGGRPDFAQAGGTDLSKINNIMLALEKMLM